MTLSISFFTILENPLLMPYSLIIIWLNCMYMEHRWDPKRLIGSGGMPSSHSATVTALAVAVGLHDGLGGSSFATALILAIIVM
ncbi:hypothetical protein HanRHA438_Chr12g0557941 [Helianthus annuus]|nr:hypothetical protein HanRHA438_Chr12g0557941 [Helianthus annuus]